jgi:ribosomal protein S12 methylthiotransferase
MRVSLLSLGCPKNLADSEGLLKKLTASGIGFTEDPGEADVMLVNTCGFIEDAKRESIDEILRLAGRKTNGKRLVVLGCLAERYREELQREIPEIDAVFGVHEEDAVVGHLTAQCGPSRAPAPAATLMEGHSAPVKVAEGCDRRCSFCVIPSIRGSFRSRKPEDILAEARAFVESGIRELTLVAQDLTAYGRDLGGHSLAALLREMASLPGDFWIRPLYLFPTDVDDGLLDAIAEEPKIVDYVDIPLQHTEDRVLRAMRRPGGRGQYLDLVGRARERIPGAALRTAFIVGFPGETEQDFQGLLDFVEEARFERLGAFMYSREEGSEAARMEGQVPKSVKEERYEELMRLQADISHGKNRALVGKTLRTFVEGVESVEGETAVGRIATQAREIDGVTYIKGAAGRELREGEFVEVEITAAHDYDLEGVCR